MLLPRPGLILSAVASGKFTRYIGWIERGDAIIILDLKGVSQRLREDYAAWSLIYQFIEHGRSSL